MPEAPALLLGMVIVAALAFDFINGFHDTANAIATCISTRAISIRNAILMAAGLNFVGALVSTHVATTIGKGIVDPAHGSQIVVLSALAGAIFWDLLPWHYGIPASPSPARGRGPREPPWGGGASSRRWGPTSWNCSRSTGSARRRRLRRSSSPRRRWGSRSAPPTSSPRRSSGSGCRRGRRKRTGGGGSGSLGR